MINITQAFQTGWGAVNTFIHTQPCQLAASIGSACISAGSFCLGYRDIKKMNSNGKSVAVQASEFSAKHPALRQEIENLSDQVSKSIKVRKTSSSFGMVASGVNTTNALVTLGMNLTENSSLSLAHSVLSKLSYSTTAGVNLVNGCIQLYACYNAAKAVRNSHYDDQSKELDKRHAKDRGMQAIATFCISSGAIASLVLLDPSVAMWTAVAGGTLSILSNFCSRRKIRNHAKQHSANPNVQRVRMVRRPSSAGKAMKVVIGNLGQSPSMPMSPQDVQSPSHIQLQPLSAGSPSLTSPHSQDIPNPSGEQQPFLHSAGPLVKEQIEERILAIGEGLQEDNVPPPPLEQVRQGSRPAPSVKSPLKTIEEITQDEEGDVRVSEVRRVHEVEIYVT